MNDKEKKKLLPRDISWMYFNKRILQEGMRDAVPIMNRMFFLGIYSNNLDEFYRVRVASLNRIVECDSKVVQRKEKEYTNEILNEINILYNIYSIEFEKAIEEVHKTLAINNILFLREDELDEQQKKFAFDYFENNLNGFFYPIWLSSIKKIGTADDENIYLAIKMKMPSANGKISSDYAVIEVSVKDKNRFILLPERDGKRCVIYLEDIIRFCLPYIFRGTGTWGYEAYSFKFTKDAEMEIDNDLQSDILQKISKAVSTRKGGEPLRILYDYTMPEDLLKKVLSKFDKKTLKTIKTSGRYQNHKDFIHFPKLDDKNLYYPIWEPILKIDLFESESILKKIKEKDEYIHLPYHSFDSFVRLLQEASINKDVKEIKISIYRLASDSKVVGALINAAKNGKKVTVVIELFARFDETSNINWSKTMQEAGINVIFGVEGIKVHSKILYIEFKKGDNIGCVSTGNFHEGNAKSYTDVILMTAKKEIVKEIKSVFDYIEKPYKRAHFKHLLVSPNEMKGRLITLINSEIKNHLAGKTAYIKIKVNNLTDTDIIKKLYEASSKGVKVDMLVRSNCSLITGIEGVSDNIKIIGIIDRYLEHERIFIFANDGDEKVYIGSADLMPRNLEHRIEVLAPIYDKKIKLDMIKVVDFGLMDSLQGRIVDGTGENRYQTDVDNIEFRSQQALYISYKNESKS